jgi:lipopolysaccharide/colanic/teichoic acid biosynthesis glycosyltransferase
VGIEEAVAERSKQRSDTYRRALDIVVSAILLVLALPVIVIAAVGSAVSLRALPFFVQHRVGRDGQLFTFIKVRTLPPDTPAYIDKHQLDARRIPPFCALLRRLHLDELPQLALVLVGRMSLVGPRPEMAVLHDELPTDFARLRTSVRPGCTGLWQISHGCTGLISNTPKYDSFYLRQRTLRFDLWVVGRTALKMTGLKGTVSLDDVPAWVLSDRDSLAEPSEDCVQIDLTDFELAESLRA